MSPYSSRASFQSVSAHGPQSSNFSMIALLGSGRRFRKRCNILRLLTVNGPARVAVSAFINTRNDLARAETLISLDGRVDLKQS